MQHRLALAFFLSFLILIIWNVVLFPPPPETAEGDAAGGPPTASPTAQPGTSPTDAAVPAEPERAAPEPVEPWRESLYLGRTGEPGHYHATFDNRGGTLATLKVDGYYTSLGLDAADQAQVDNWVTLVDEVDTGRGIETSLALSASRSSLDWFPRDLATVRWEAEWVEEGGARSGVRFVHTSESGVKLVKTIRSSPGDHDLLVDLELANVEAPEAWEGRLGVLRLTPAVGVPRSASDGFYMEPKAGTCWRDGPRDFGVDREQRSYGKAVFEALPPTEGIVWAGVDSKYFAVLLRPVGNTATALTGVAWRTIWDAVWVAENPEDSDEGFRHVAADVELSLRLPARGESSYLSFRLYAGPKDRAEFLRHADGEALAKLVSKDLGFFDGIASLLLRILGFFHGIVGNWGWSIILLTLTVRVVLFPINRRSQTAMARHATKMKRVQPKLTEVKERYKNDPKKLREEQARIMQEEGAFPPLGGCLPIFLQIPVFFGLFSALRTSFDLRQAPFVSWIKDLSEPDRLLRIDVPIPLLGTIEYLNILPPLMVVLWILQQKVMPKPTDEQALRMQRMMMWMPILFGFFLYNYAAGLSLYMITTSVFGVMEQTVIKKIWPIDDTEKPKKKKSGFMQRMADMQEQAKKLEAMKREERDKRARQHKRRKKGGGR